MITRLSESITHIEDLPIDEFIDVLQNIDTMTAQEKLDGAQLWVGIDDDGKFYTSREGKRANNDRRYSEADWPKISAFDQFRAAHLALEQKVNELKLVLRPGDTLEVEVLYGSQPNSVMYGADGASYIAFLRGVHGTSDGAAKHLSQLLNNQTVEVNFEAIDTDDGKELRSAPTKVKFKFLAPQQINTEKLKSDIIDSELAKLKKFLSAKSPIHGMSNGELATVALTSIHVDQRADVKAARSAVLDQIQTDFKQPIKQRLLDRLVRQTKSNMSDPQTDQIGIEGVVLRDETSGTQVKIVDKDVFTAINQFNQSVRAEIQSSLNTTDPTAPLASRGGLTGELRIKIASALGNRELAKPANLRKVLQPMKGAGPEDAIRNLAKSLNVQDFQAVKRKILAMISETAKELSARLESFKKNHKDYRLSLKNGKEIGLSDDTVKKTLVSFAEARRNLTSLFDKLKTTKSTAQLLAVLYGGQAVAVHQKVETPVAEELLLEKKGELDISTYADKDVFELLNTYLATVMMSMIIYHVNDVPGMRRLRDRKNFMLKKHDNDMSPLNHWGYAIWKCTKPEVRKHLQPDTSKKMAAIIKDIPRAWSKFLHMDFSFDRQVNVDWADHKKTLERLIELAGLRNERLNTMLDMSVRFNDLELTEQRRLIKMLNTFAHRFVPRSSLYVRTRIIADKLKDAKEAMIAEGLLKTVSALAEDEVSGGGAPIAASTSSAIASAPVRLLDTRRRVEKRRRNPIVDELTKKFKDPRKEKDDTAS